AGPPGQIVVAHEQAIAGDGMGLQPTAGLAQRHALGDAPITSIVGFTLGVSVVHAHPARAFEPITHREAHAAVQRPEAGIHTQRDIANDIGLVVDLAMRQHYAVAVRLLCQREIFTATLLAQTLGLVGDIAYLATNTPVFAHLS